MKILLTFSFIFLMRSVSVCQETRFLESFDMAEDFAIKKNIPVVIYFSGSDWCKPCIKLKKEVLMSDEFAVYSRDLAIYIADFPFRKKQSKAMKKLNGQLAERYNAKGIFPFLVVLGKDGKVIYQTGFKDQKPADFISDMKNGISKKQK